MADQQDLELEALRAIYSEDFINCPPPKVWKVGLLYHLVRTAHQEMTPSPSNHRVRELVLTWSTRNRVLKPSRSSRYV